MIIIIIIISKQSKQTRHSVERQEGKNLSAYRYVHPHRKEHLLENNGKTHKDLEIEIEKTWAMKTTTVPVIIGAFGLVKKGTENYIGKIPGNIRITELQKTVLLGTAHILRRTLSVK